MKLRIRGNSLRLRVSPSEMARLLETGRIEETIRFAPQQDAKLTYGLEHAAAERELSLRYRAQDVTVVLPSEVARTWAVGERVGLQGTVNVGQDPLVILVEKDLACLDGNDEENQDTFPNPNRGVTC